MTDTPHRVFAYGALKAGGANHRLLRGARFYGRVRTAGRYRMWAAAFPLVRPAEESAPRADRAP